MNWKNFLKLDVKKIVLLIILFILFSILFSHYRAICIEGGTTFGFPYNFYSNCNNAVSQGTILGNPKFDIIGFIVNLIFWYLISALLISLYNKIRK